MDDKSEANLGLLMEVSLKVMLECVEAEEIANFERALNACVDLILYVSTKHRSRVFSAALRAWSSSPQSAAVRASPQRPTSHPRFCRSKRLWIWLPLSTTSVTTVKLGPPHVPI